jgi:sugar phosphate isomerase/epimerase
VKRRDFVRSLGALSLAPLAPVASLVPTALGDHDHHRRRSPSLKRIGLELYSVRNEMRADPEGTLAKVREIGYDDVELLWSFNNFGRTAEQVRDSLRQLGLGAPSAHIAPEALLKDWEKSVETARLLGHEYLIVPSLPAETRRSLDAWRLWADRFNNAGQIANKGGVWLAFHNEPDHQRTIEGQIPYDLFLQRTDPSVVRHQLDIGNMVMGGGDPLKYLQRYRDRYFSFHIKDIVSDRSRDTELGKGTVNIRQILAAIPALDTKPCYVEQEAPADALASARANYAWLRGLEF